jgi:hypothetical protein
MTFFRNKNTSKVGYSPNACGFRPQRSLQRREASFALANGQSASMVKNMQTGVNTALHHGYH